MAKQTDEREEGGSALDEAPDAITDNQIANVEARPDDDDGDDAPEPTERVSRKDYRAANRKAVQEASARAAQAEARANEVSARLQQLEAAQRQVQQNPLPRYQPPQTQQSDDEMQRIYDAQENLVYRLRSDQGLTPEQQQSIAREHRRLDEHRLGVIARRATAGAMPQQQRSDPAEEQTRFENMQLRTEFPEVFGDESLRLEALAELHRLQKAGRAVNYQTAREAAKSVANRYKKPEFNPSEGQKAKFAGTPARAGATGQGGGGGVRPSQQQMRMARALYPGIDDQQAWDKWVKNVGKPAGLV